MKISRAPARKKVAPIPGINRTFLRFGYDVNPTPTGAGQNLSCRLEPFLIRPPYQQQNPTALDAFFVDVCLFLSHAKTDERADKAPIGRANTGASGCCAEHSGPDAPGEGGAQPWKDERTGASKEADQPTKCPSAQRADTRRFGGVFCRLLVQQRFYRLLPGQNTYFFCAVTGRVEAGKRLPRIIALQEHCKCSLHAVSLH